MPNPKKVFNLLEKIALAHDSDCPARVVAALYHKNTLIPIGLNQRKTHPLQARFADNPECIFLHAEIDDVTRRFSIE